MLFGRPVTLWGSLITACIAFLQVAIVTLVPNVDAGAVALLLGSLGGLLGVVVAFLANQPPTLAVNDTYKIETPKGEPNYVATVAQPPAAAQPVPDPNG
jgi:hypothetical protein